MKTNRDLPDFETLVALHRCDPMAFEAVRSSLLQSCIDDAPAIHRPELEKLVSRMEGVRATASSPLEAATAAAHLMVESLNALHDQFVLLAEESAAWQTSILMRRLRSAK